MRKKRGNPIPSTTSRPEPAASYSADWPDPDSPGSTCGIHAGASGVTVWSSAGNPHTENGRSYTWEEWFDSGSPGRGSPPGLLARIDEAPRQWGKLPPPTDTRPVTRRADLDLDPATQDAEHRRYLEELRKRDKSPRER